jgi:hypothetical protein
MSSGLFQEAHTRVRVYTDVEVARPPGKPTNGQLRSILCLDHVIDETHRLHHVIVDPLLRLVVSTDAQYIL